MPRTEERDGPTRGGKSLRDLRPWKRNPRMISTKQREALLRSYLLYGDLSGIVVNDVTGDIIGGHQRSDIFRNRNTRIVERPCKDSTGTVAIGEVLVPQSNGGTLRIPFRRVRFDAKKQAAANIAANAAGGEFDDLKLGKILTDLKEGRFPSKTWLWTCTRYSARSTCSRTRRRG